MTCATCGARPEAGLILCRTDRPVVGYCAPCYPAYVKKVHDGTEDEQPPEDTECWRQIGAAVRRASGPVRGWMLIEAPKGEPDAADDEWFCIAFTVHEDEATAWHAPEAGRRARAVEVGTRG